MFGRADGAIFALLLFVSSLLGSIFLLFPILPVSFFAPRLFRKIADKLIGYWLTFPCSLIFFLFRVKVHVTGDLILRDAPAIIISNHRTRLDWLFFWNALYRMDPVLLTKEKIVLKSQLKNIPGAGWSMCGDSFIFLNRDIAKDKQIIERMLKYYKDSQRNYQILLFPEGTDRGDRAVSISHKYADDNKLDRYNYVLHPRTTGFNLFLNEMRKNNYIQYVYDITVAYPENIVASEFELAKEGIFPAEVHFDVKRYDIAEICGDEADLSKPVDASRWLTSLWKAKEKRLEEYYKGTKRFVPSGSGFVWPVSHFSMAYFAAFLFWVISSVFWTWLFYTSFYVKIYALISVSFFIWAQKSKGGLELLILEFFYGRRFYLSPNESF